MTNLAVSAQSDAQRPDTSARNAQQLPVRSSVDTDLEERSWEEIVRTHATHVYRLAYRLTGNQYDAEDLTQHVFVKVFNHLHSHSPGIFQGWLHRITTCLFLDSTRLTSRVQMVGNHADDLDSRPPSPDQILAGRVVDIDVQTALNALPPDLRVVVVLCDIEGLGHDEIAAILTTQLGTVRSRLHRGRAQLRLMLADGVPRQRAELASAPAPGVEA